MTTAAEDSRETGIWYDGTSARNSDIALVERATRNLGNLTMRVVDNTEEARGVVLGIATIRFQGMYPDASPAIIAEAANLEADIFVREMEPSAVNGQDPRRLIRVESTDGSPVEPHRISEEIKFRVKPGLAQQAITGTEVLYTALNPVGPQTLLD